MIRLITVSLVVAAAFTALACDDGGDDGISIDATGAVAGVVWLDRNGNGLLDGSDGPVRDIRVELVPRAGRGAAYSGESTARGEFIIDDVLVGNYTAVVDSGTVGDTLRVLRVDSADVTVEAGDTSAVLVALTYPSLPVDTARLRPPEFRLFVEGLVLTRWGTFGDETLHVRDTTGAIRAVRVQPTGVVPGDSVRVLGTTTVQAGQPVLRDGIVFRLRTGVESPPKVTVTTGDAATAAGGELDAELVYVDSAVVRDTSRNDAREVVVTVDDGSGEVDVVLDRDITFSLQFDTEVVGTILRVTGVLVPASAGEPWVIKPRSSSDLVVGPLSWPTVTVVEARAEPADTRLVIYGIALNAWSTFADSTVHVRDATGAIRALRVPPAAIVAGDSVRVVATTGVLWSQPVLTKVSMRVEEQGETPPEADSVSTGDAGTADVGRLDADLVRIAAAEIQDTSRNSLGEPILTVDDGSGPVDVLLDRDVTFFLAFPVVDGKVRVIGSELDVTGLLVPSATAGRWILKPRRSDDVAIR